MRNIFAFDMVTLDGFFEGPNREIDWHVWDEEMNQFSIDQGKEIDTLLFGRVTYQLMAGYWPTPAGLRDDPVTAAMMNSLPKIVFSRTLDKVEWQNSRLLKGDIAQQVSLMKQQPGKDMAIFGSGSIVSAFAQVGMIDEYRIMVNPVVLGSGNTLFRGLTDRLSLRLLRTRTFASGNVLLYYQPVKK